MVNGHCERADTPQYFGDCIHLPESVSRYNDYEGKTLTTVPSVGSWLTESES